MRKIVALILGLGICSFLSIASADVKQNGSPEAEFNEHCAACHPGGGNSITPAKTLHKKNLEQNGIKTPRDIVKIIRNPGPGMTAFDKDAIPDEEAKDIAEYILRTFK